MQQKMFLTVGVIVALTLTLAGCSQPSEAGSTNQTGATKFAADKVPTDNALAADVPSAIKSRGTLVVGSDTTYPPDEYLAGADGQTAVGLDVDLTKAIAKTLGLKLDFQTAGFDSILPAIGSKYDLGVSAFTITNARYGAVDFVSYFNAGKQWAVRKGNPTKFDTHDVCGANIGVQTGTTDEAAVKQMSTACTEAGKKAVNLVSLGKQTDIITRLVNGAVDASYAGSTSLEYAVKQTTGKLQTLGGITQPSPNGIAVAKGNTKWASVVAEALNKLIADGDYKKILATWGATSGAVPNAEVNPKVSE